MSKRLPFAPLAAAIGLGFSLIAGSLVAPTVAHAEGEIRIAEQFGIVYLLLNVVRDQGLIEKYGKQEGLDIKVDWTQLSGGAAVNDALLSGSIDIAGAGVGPQAFRARRGSSRPVQRRRDPAPSGVLPRAEPDRV